MRGERWGGAGNGNLPDLIRGHDSQVAEGAKVRHTGHLNGSHTVVVVRGHGRRRRRGNVHHTDPVRRDRQAKRDAGTNNADGWQRGDTNLMSGICSTFDDKRGTVLIW